MPGAAYNSRIPRMRKPLSSRLVISLAFVLALLFGARGAAQNWTGAEEQLAGKIVSVTGPKTIALDVVNRSSLSPAVSDDIRRNLLTQLAVRGVRFVAAEQAAASVRVSLSEDLQSYVWVAEIRQVTNTSGANTSGANTSSIVMVSLPRPATLSIEPEAAAMVLHRISLWSQPERILDVAVIDGNPADGNPARMLVLDANGVTFYRQQDGRWQPEQSLPIVHSQAWPRDLRGRLVLRNNDKNHLFDAYLPGVYCRSSAAAPPAMTCYDSHDPWPLGTDQFVLNASFTSARNFFSGPLSPGVGNPTTAPPFYSAAVVPRNQSAWWLLATVDGQVHLLDGATDQRIEKLGWGSDIASVRSSCGSGWQVLATASGDGQKDAVRAFEVPGREPVAASAPLEVSGAVTALWTESAGTGVVGVAHNSETGRYEAFRLTLACGR